MIRKLPGRPLMGVVMFTSHAIEEFLIKNSNAVDLFRLRQKKKTDQNKTIFVSKDPGHRCHEVQNRLGKTWDMGNMYCVDNSCTC